MAYSHIVTTKKASSDNNAVTSDAIDTTGANFLAVFAVNYQAAAENPLSDSKSNTWTKKTVYEQTNLNRGVWYFCRGGTVGSGHTFSLGSVANSFPTIFALAFSGAAVSPSDQENGAAAGSGQEINTGSVTPTEDNELILAGLCLWNNSTDHAIDSGMTGLEVIATGANNIPGGVAYKIQTTAAAINPKFTWLNTGPSIGIIETFKAAGVAGTTHLLGYSGGPRRILRRRRVA